MMNSIVLIKDIISRYYVTREISDSAEFKEVCRVEINKIVFNEVFEQLIELHDGDFVGDLFHIGFILDFFDKKQLNTLNKLLLESWHKSHEDIVSLYQMDYNNDSDNIAYLLKALEFVPEYLQPDDFKYPYMRKIIYAIGAQPEPFNIQTLEKLAKSGDVQIRDLAIHQIKKRKKLGRWESNQK